MLLTVSGPEGSEFEESRNLVVVSNASFGRALDNTLITRDALVSRHHLELSEENGKFYVQDVGSTTGNNFVCCNQPSTHS
jgi:pSer/pThr/pTyr-binding forkhead associated (FHA) protein